MGGNHSHWLESNMDALDDDVRTRVQRCRQFSAATPEEKRTDEDKRRRYIDAYGELVGKGRAIAIPAMRGLAPFRSATLEQLREFRVDTFRLVAPGSLCGAPQVMIPVREIASGLTIGLGLAGIGRQ